MFLVTATTQSIPTLDGACDVESFLVKTGAAEILRILAASAREVPADMHLCHLPFALLVGVGVECTLSNMP